MLNFDTSKKECFASSNIIECKHKLSYSGECSAFDIVNPENFRNRKIEYNQPHIHSEKQIATRKQAFAYIKKLFKK